MKCYCGRFTVPNCCGTYKEDPAGLLNHTGQVCFELDEPEWIKSSDGMAEFGIPGRIKRIIQPCKHKSISWHTAGHPYWVCQDCGKQQEWEPSDGGGSSFIEVTTTSGERFRTELSYEDRGTVSDPGVDYADSASGD